MDSITYTDAQLVMRVWDCDNDAFEELAVRYQKSLFYLIRGLVSNPEDAEDCAQEALFKVYTAMKERRKPDEPDKFWPYLKQIARNVVVDIFRLRERTSSRMDELSQAVAVLDHSFDDIELQQMIDKLPRHERTVIWMYYFEGYGVDEIAERLRYRQPWVSKRKKRGETLLREMWRRSK